jgi:hypothetical protein
MFRTYRITGPIERSLSKIETNAKS